MATTKLKQKGYSKSHCIVVQPETDMGVSQASCFVYSDTLSCAMDECEQAFRAMHRCCNTVATREQGRNLALSVSAQEAISFLALSMCCLELAWSLMPHYLLVTPQDCPGIADAETPY